MRKYKSKLYGTCKIVLVLYNFFTLFHLKKSMLEQVFGNLDTTKYVDMATSGILAYAPKVFGALIVLWIGFKVANMIGKMVDKLLKAREIDPTVEAFLVSLLKNILKALVFVAAVGVIGVETSSFVAMFAAIGLAIGMALSGTLGHFASGIMILLFKPYKVGDFITTAGHTGTVTEVQIFNTVLQTPQGKTVIIPNSEAIGSSIENFSVVAKKRVDMTVGIDYGDDIDLAKSTLEQIAKDADVVLHDEGYTIGVEALADSSVNIAFKVWVKSEDALGAPLILNEAIKKEFDKVKGLNFPFPQRDVHLYNMK